MEPPMPQDELKEDLRQYLPSRTTADRLARGDMWKTPPMPGPAEAPKDGGSRAAAPRPGPPVQKARGRLWYSAIAAACVLVPIVVLLVLLRPPRASGSGDADRGASTGVGRAVTAGPPAASSAPAVVPSTSTSAGGSRTATVDASAAPSTSAGAPEAVPHAPASAPTASAAVKPTAVPRTSSTAPLATSPTAVPESPPAPSKPAPFDPLMNE